MKDEVKANLVDSFAPAQSPLPLRLCRLLCGSQLAVFSPACLLAKAFEWLILFSLGRQSTVTAFSPQLIRRSNEYRPPCELRLSLHRPVS